MTAGWTRVTRLFDEACGVPAHERESWLQRACEDEAVRREVLALLRAYDEDPGFLETPADTASAGAQVEQQLRGAVEGRLVGPYRIVREIGRGGVGVVYEAHREGQDFGQRVAMKVLPAACRRR